MWDGFETIYDKEISVPDTEVTIIPIPTYDRNHDDTLANAEYITEGYPECLKITGLNDYDLSKKQPDRIYIQNISDSCNAGFTVHPHFYSSNLRNFTKDLVYIPYNCITELDPEYEDLRQYYGEILTPSTIVNANHIIVQSENTKNVYLELIAGKNDLLKNEWTKKISFIDYPRKAILKKYSSDTVRYPSSWNAQLFNTDRSQKKTVLFCTSVFEILENNRLALKKIKTTLDYYQNQKSNTALIWRPNRNLPEIIKKLRPELLNDFNLLLEYYTQNNIGILDKTPSPTAPIILSHEYIGADCGVKELFKSTGKPCLPW